MPTRTDAIKRITAALREFEELAADEHGLTLAVPLNDLSDEALLDSCTAVGRVFHTAQAALAEFASEISHRSPAGRGERSLCNLIENQRVADGGSLQ